MANSDYVARPSTFGFCPTASLLVSIGQLETSITMTAYSSPIPNGIRIGMAAMIGTEIISIVGRTGDVLTIGRGCCDTIPATHAAGSTIWFFDDSIGRDSTEYIGTETIGVKIRPRTSSGGPVPIEHAPAQTVSMNLRFARPYPPGLMRVNGEPWYSGFGLTDGEQLELTWKHRDRLTQQDQLVPHVQDNIGPEMGVTYEIKVYKGASLVRTESIPGNLWQYTYVMATTDFAVTSGNHAGTITVVAKRDGLASFQHYSITFTLVVPPQAYGLGFRLGERLGGTAP